MLYAICYMLYALCYMLYATCYMLHATCYMLYAICYMLYAICHPEELLLPLSGPLSWEFRIKSMILFCFSKCFCKSAGAAQ